MKTFLVSLALAISLVLALPADAKSRFGSGKSTGMQRDSAKPSAATPATAAPAGAAAPAAAAATAGAAAKPAAAAAGNKWLGPLAGLAAGGLLASMFMGGGMGGFGGFKIFDFIMLIGFAVAAFYLFRMWRNRSSANNAAPSNLAYAGASNSAPDYAPAPPASQRTSSTGNGFTTPEIGSRLQSVSTPAEANALAQAPRIPADFEAEQFVRHARGAFIRMQAANDVGDKADIRDFTTPEMYAEISMQIQERKGETQRTDVTKLDVTLLEVVTENSKSIASVRFMGELQFEGETSVEKFDEVWHVVKRVDEPNATWLVAGIQQLS